jgi:hypothetical protein
MVTQITFIMMYEYGHYVASHKVTDSISYEVIEYFNWPNPSSRTMALESIQSLTEMSTRNLPGIHGSHHIRLTISQPSMSRLHRKCDSLDVS